MDKITENLVDDVFDIIYEYENKPNNLNTRSICEHILTITISNLLEFNSEKSTEKFINYCLENAKDLNKNLKEKGIIK